jgi:anthranilate 1,2-dioxygenase small subunit
MMNVSTTSIPGDVRSLLCDYAHVLDDGRLIEWPEFFTEQGLYRITTRQLYNSNQPLSIMFCDNRAMLYDRVEATEKANIFEPHTYRHVLSDSRVVEAAQDRWTLDTSFICTRTMLNGDLMVFATGRYVDEVVREGEKLLFGSRTVVLDQSKIDTLIAIPL